jgi:hypothetical protein
MIVALKKVVIILATGNQRYSVFYTFNILWYYVADIFQFASLKKTTAFHKKKSTAISKCHYTICYCEAGIANIYHSEMSPVINCTTYL